MDYNIIKEPCFVCEIEDKLNQTRGTQSHPINCGWRVKRENKGYEKGLDEIVKLCDNRGNMEVDELIKKIKNIAIHSLMARYDVEK